MKKQEDEKLIKEVQESVATKHPISTQTATPKKATKKNSSNVNMSKYIPTVDKEYINRRICKKTDMNILTQSYKMKFNTLLIGETGSGKSHALRHLAFKLKVPYMRVNLNGATTPEDLIGQWIPSNGSYKWQDGVLTTFMREGGIFVCDEINACPPEILFILHSLLDDERRIVLVQKDGEVVNAHQDFYFASSMNPDYEGTKPLNSALKDRFEVVLTYDYSEPVEKKLIKNNKLIALSKGLRDLFRRHEIETPLSTRALMHFEMNSKIFGEEIARKIFTSKFATEEQRVVDELLSIHLDGAEIDEKKEDDEE